MSDEAEDIWPICIEIDVEGELFEVSVNESDDPRSIAADFCAGHELPEAALQPIADFIRDEVGEVVKT